MVGERFLLHPVVGSHSCVYETILLSRAWVFKGVYLSDTGCHLKDGVSTVVSHRVD